jgi:CHRD domain-containing protein
VDEVLDALRRGKTYVNVHSSVAPAGEVRGQIE